MSEPPTVEQLDELDWLDFAGEYRTYPADSADDVEQSVQQYQREKPGSEVKRRLIAIAYKNGLESSLPESWRNHKSRNLALIALLFAARRAVGDQVRSYAPAGSTIPAPTAPNPTGVPVTAPATGPLSVLRNGLTGVFQAAAHLGGADDQLAATIVSAAVAKQAPYIDGFEADITTGRYKLPDGALDVTAIERRADLYLRGVRATANEAWAKSTDPSILFDWVLGGCEHCADCPELAANGPYTLESLPSYPGDGSTECMAHCCCMLRRQDGGIGFSAFDPSAALFSEELTMPDESVHFSIVPFARYVDGDYAVYPNSLLFRAGKYEDKKFEMSRAELADRAKNWKPVSGNIAHTDFLRGRAAFIQRAWMDDADPDVLRGEVKVPLGLDELLTDAERKISMEWQRAGKFEEGFALVTNPRVSDAALMSDERIVEYAGKRHSDADLRDMQAVHDIACRQGADCRANMAGAPARSKRMDIIEQIKNLVMGSKPEAEAAKFDDAGQDPDTELRAYNTPEGQDIMQIIHDQASRAGAVCAHDNSGVAGFVAQHESEGVQRIHDETMKHGAKCGAVREGSSSMYSADDQARFDALQSEVQALKADKRLALASAFADGLIAEGKITPAERFSVVAAFSQAMIDDEASPTVSFGADGPKSRVDAVKALYAERPAHNLFGEAVTTFAAQGRTPGRDGNGNINEGELDPKRIEKLKSMMPGYSPMASNGSN